MSKILHELASHFDMVIVDAPPVLLVTDALVLATYVDGVLIVIKPSNTKWAAMKNLLEQMHQVNANILGIVINDVKVNRSSYYNQKYNSHYNYFETGSEPSEDPKIPAAKEASNVPNFLKITESAQKKKNDSPVITGKVE